MTENLLVELDSGSWDADLPDIAVATPTTKSYTPARARVVFEACVIARGEPSFGCVTM